MFTWLVDNIATVIVCAVLAGFVVLVIVKLIKDRKKGKSSCSCGCSSCSMYGSCGGKSPDEKK